MAQRRFEIEFAGHRSVGHRLHFGKTARLGGEKLDHFVLDERGVDVEHDEAFGPSTEPLSLNGDVEIGLGGRCCQKRTTQLLLLGGPHQELIGHHGVAREPHDAVDVRPDVGDCSGDGTEFARCHVGAEHCDDEPGRRRGRGRRHDLHIDLDAFFPTPQQHIAEEIPARRNVDDDPERDLSANHDLLDVLHAGIARVEHGHEPGVDTGPVRTADPDQHGLRVAHSRTVERRNHQRTSISSVNGALPRIDPTTIS